MRVRLLCLLDCPVVNLIPLSLASTTSMLLLLLAAGIDRKFCNGVRNMVSLCHSFDSRTEQYIPVRIMIMLSSNVPLRGTFLCTFRFWYASTALVVCVTAERKHEEVSTSKFVETVVRASSTRTHQANEREAGELRSKAGRYLMRMISMALNQPCATVSGSKSLVPQRLFSS